MSEADKVWENHVNSVFGFWKGFKRDGDRQLNTNVTLDDMKGYIGYLVLAIVIVIGIISLL